eukprot:420342-Pleurochrysis_carterae.AAC.1
MGEGLPASRRARPCGCRSVAATVRLATRRLGSLSRSCAGRIYGDATSYWRPGGPGEISVYASGAVNAFDSGLDREVVWLP